MSLSYEPSSQDFQCIDYKYPTIQGFHKYDKVSAFFLGRSILKSWNKNSN